MPGAHGLDAAYAVPAGQYEPSAHAAAGAVRPALGHEAPAVHGAHACTVLVALNAPNVPAGHGVGAAEPAPQYAPAGHTMHAVAFMLPLVLTNEPAGHANCVANSVAGGQ